MHLGVRVRHRKSAQDVRLARRLSVDSASDDSIASISDLLLASVVTTTEKGAHPLFASPPVRGVAPFRSPLSSVSCITSTSSPSRYGHRRAVPRAAVAGAVAVVTAATPYHLPPAFASFSFALLRPSPPPAVAGAVLVVVAALVAPTLHPVIIALSAVVAHHGVATRIAPAGSLGEIFVMLGACDDGVLVKGHEGHPHSPHGQKARSLHIRPPLHDVIYAPYNPPFPVTFRTQDQRRVLGISTCKLQRHNQQERYRIDASYHQGTEPLLAARAVESALSRSKTGQPAAILVFGAPERREVDQPCHW
eukprot:Sspe_Gene.60121::Locus_33095_Transcript_1_12_Confidence_1.000_Length_1004::g.60121::m.60121